MVAGGQVPWAMGFESGGATGWTGSDWIEDILLVTQGPDFVRGLIDGSTRYDDPAVKEAYELYGKWATDPTYTVGGAQGTLSTKFEDAIYSVLADPPQAMMVRQSGFAGGLIAAQYPNLQYGTDYDFFELPGVQGMQTGADWMMAFSDKPAVQALYAYVSSEAGAQAWAQQVFDITPNTAAQGTYSDEALGKRADILYNADDTVPDIGDTIPGGFGTAEWTAIVNYVNGGDLDQALAAVAAAQMSAVQAGGTAVPDANATPAGSPTP
jgi:alpha-glucoside transport system substrate-binding protein